MKEKNPTKSGWGEKLMLNLSNRKTAKKGRPHMQWKILVILPVIGLVSCGGGGSRELGDVRYAISSAGHLSGSAVSKQPQGDFISPVEALKVEKPASSDEAQAPVLAQLKRELEKRLFAKGAGMLVSTPPIASANSVNDLTIVDNGDGTLTLSWTYKNVGDYNQDGFVDIADITPIAEHFFESADSTNNWIDGNGDRIIDVADVGPLAENFFVECTGYSILASDNPFVGYEEIASVPLSDAIREGALRFTEVVSLPVGNWVKVAPVDRYGATGVERLRSHWRRE